MYSSEPNNVELRFRPEEYFSGPCRGYGVFYDRFGKIQSRLSVELIGDWDGSVLHLHEKLVNEKGEVTNRTFEIRKISEQEYEARTPDFVGPGKIECFGNSLKWTYTLKRPMAGKHFRLKFEDWMHLQPEGLLLDRAYARKFGFLVGELFMVIKRDEAGARPHDDFFDSMQAGLQPVH